MYIVENESCQISAYIFVLNIFHPHERFCIKETSNQEDTSL